MQVVLGVETPDEEPANQQQAQQLQGQTDNVVEQEDEEEEEQQAEGSGEALEGGADADAMDADGGEGASAGPSRAPGGRRQQQQAGGVVEVTTHLREYVLDGTVTAREEMAERMAEGVAAGGGVQRIALKHIDGEGGLLETAFEVGLAAHRIWGTWY